MTHDDAVNAAHHVAVIGHGPAAIETSDLLICMGDHFVDLFSSAPAPTCLIRFGSTHRAPTTGTNLVPRLRLFGNVQVGSAATAISVGELTRYYDTVITRRLSCPACSSTSCRWRITTTQRSVTRTARPARTTAGKLRRPAKSSPPITRAGSYSRLSCS